MRAPRPPRKPTNLGSPQPGKDRGGEAFEPGRAQLQEDYVPTAAFDDAEYAEFVADDWDDADDEVEPINDSDDPQPDIPNEPDREVYESPVRLSDRRSEKRAEQRRIVLKRVGIVSLALGIVALVGWLVFFSPVFRYGFSESDITITGDIVDVEEVAGVIRGYEGRALILIDTDAVEQEIVDAVPEVKAAVVTRSLPSSLDIEITPFEPLACVGDDPCAVVAEDGTELDVPQDLAATLPRLASLPEGLEPQRALRDVLEVLNALSSDVRASVTSVDIADNGIIAFTLSGQATVNWGVSGTDNAFKSQLLDALLAQDATYYDVSVPSSPVTSN